ncbi:MAG: spermidine synthase [Actinomycetota bacterium]|nr:spermidine synthase [Actinomycetota bacterium]
MIDFSDRVRLVLLSFLMLFVELALIRWTGSNVVYLSYFSNFVLLGSFLGIGLGFLRGSRDPDLFRIAPFALVFLVAFVAVFPVEIDRTGSDVIYFGGLSPSGLPPWLTLPVIFVAVAVVLMTIAHGVARVFVRLEPLEAYRFDILGSLAGIVAFSALSFLHAPPVFWGGIAALLFVLLLPRDVLLVGAATLGGLVVLLGVESLEPQQSWSPYYKVTVVDNPSVPLAEVSVNGIPHQSIQTTASRREREPLYVVPYERRPQGPLDEVLIVGAGNGTDVAIALEQGAKHVDAVEIDPRLYELGVELHPDHPYQHEGVDVHINDGRAYLEQTDKRYDLILFALPDSLTLVPGQSSLRLESYLFTREAMEVARSRLTSDGMFGMYNYYREEWLIDRLYRTLTEVYGHPPCVDSVGASFGLALLSAGLEPDAVNCPTPQPVAGLDAVPAPPPSTDDKPFLYLRTSSIPSLYLVTIALMFLASLVFVRVAGGPLRGMSGYADLFLMGAAFLLLETKNVVQFALLFGTTWFVNALVFAGILVVVLAAIEVARRTRAWNPRILYGSLFASLLLAGLVPQHSLLAIGSIPLRFVVATLIAFTPVFIANLIFAERFKQVAASNIAFGANLLGAMAGGLIEYAALITGYNALLLLVGALYLMAFVVWQRSAGAEPEAAAA